MEEFYFMVVDLHKKCNKLEKEIGRYVYNNYHRNVVARSRVAQIKKLIDDKLVELAQLNPRCTPLKSRTIWTERTPDEQRFVIIVYTDNYYSPSPVLSLVGYQIANTVGCVLEPMSFNNG